MPWTGRAIATPGAQAFENIGLPAAQRPSATAWATANFQQVFGWTHVFYDLAQAAAARAQFVAGVDEIKIIGVGLPEHHLPQFLAEADPALGSSGYYEVASQRQPLAAGAFLGYELLNTEFGLLDHSWLCNGLETHCFQVLGVRPNPSGFLADLETAERCCAEISRDAVGAEPGLWLPWAIVEYA